MANQEEKLFRVSCIHCNKPFHIRAKEQNPNAQGKTEVAVDCPYCSKAMMVEIDLKYAEPDVIVRRV